VAVLGLAGSAVVAAPLAAAASPSAARPSVAASAVRSLSPAAPDDNASTPEPTDPASPGLVIVGTGGVYWTDVEHATMPTLWRMVSEGSVASISVRTGNPQTCPVDAWLTLSAGRRTLASVVESTPGSDAGDGPVVAADCTPVPVADTVPAQSAEPVPVDLAGWAALTALPVDQGGGTAGALGSRTAEAGSCTTAVGPGAAVALADRDGHVARYVPSADRIDTALLVACPVTVVDAGEPSVEPAERQAALHDLDALLRRIVEAVPEGWRVVVAGVYDTPVDDHGLQVVVDWHRGGRSRTAGTSPS